MLRQTFLHIRGVGYRTEERLWRAGVTSWDAFPEGRTKARIPRTLARRIEDELDRSKEALRRQTYRYFAENLTPREHWRAWPDFRTDVAFLDIETTGLSIGRDGVTVVGLYDGKRKRSFIKGINLEELPRALEPVKMLVTFNGQRFDVPFLRRAFPRTRLDQIHIDLVHPLHRLGFYGGLKRVESRLGIERSAETAGLSGFDAVQLWHAYEQGEDDALDLLVAYNLEDVVNLEVLAEFAYAELRSLCMGNEFVTADRLERASGRSRGIAPPGTSPRSS
jgi:uncharacterized protein YprB with RNaseH-like and TPR domain